MRLYRIMGAGWAGTPADAKAASKHADAPWHETEVPTDKPGLLAWLNERNVPGPEEIEQIKNARLPLAAAEQVARSQDVTALCDWLDDAEPWQIARVFETLASRLAEIAKLREAA